MTELFKKLLSLDKRYSENIYKSSENHTNLARIINIFTGMYGTLPLFFLIIVTSDNFFKSGFTIIILGILFAVGFEHYLKKFLKRKRPTYSILKSYSFPSTHALSTMTLVIFWVLTSTDQSVLLTALIFVYLIKIGISRVFLGFHYLSDILGGWLMGLGVGIVSSMIYLLVR